MTLELERMAEVKAAEAAEAGPRAVALAMQGGGGAGAFRAAQRLRQASEAAGAAAREEAGAEAAAEALAARFRAAQEHLVRAARAAAGAHPAVGAGLQAWLDPYAPDAAGRGALSHWRAQLSGAAGPGIDAVRSAMDLAQQAGAAWDAAEARRAAAIAQRAGAMRAWQAAVAGLLAAAGPGAWLDALPTPAPPAAEDDWFVE